MYTQEEKEWLSDLEIEKLTPILELLKGISFQTSKHLLKKATELLEKKQNELIF